MLQSAAVTTLHGKYDIISDLVYSSRRVLFTTSSFSGADLFLMSDLESS